MAQPVRRNLSIYTGDVCREHFAFITSVGRYIENLSMSDGSTAVTGTFETTDNGKVITVVDGSGIADGTTITVTSTTTATLSAAATEDREGVKAIIGPADLSGYTGNVAQIRASKDSADTLAEFTVTNSRAAYGIVTLSLTESETAALESDGVWDWQCDGPYGNVTLVAGMVKRVKDVSQ